MNWNASTAMAAGLTRADDGREGCGLKQMLQPTRIQRLRGIAYRAPVAHVFAVVDFAIEAGEFGAGLGCGGAGRWNLIRGRAIGRGFAAEVGIDFNFGRG